MPSLKNAARILRALCDMRSFHTIRVALLAQSATPLCECTVCGYRGKFLTFGADSRPGVWCPRCKSLERHRLLALAIRRGFLSFADRRVLHFAPEPCLVELIQKSPGVTHLTADITPGAGMRVIDIEAIDELDAAFDSIICSHVLEHVDDAQALRELHRVLKPSGSLVALVPIVEGWTQTYEDPTKVTERERELHFGQFDHIRFYGADFRQRVTAAGFAIEEFTAFGADCVAHALRRGEKVFLCRKAA